MREGITREERRGMRALVTAALSTVQPEGFWADWMRCLDALDAADALRAFMKHTPTCAVYGDGRHSASAWLVVKNPQPCDCGRDAALAAYDALVEPAR